MRRLLIAIAACGGAQHAPEPRAPVVRGDAPLGATQRYGGAQLLLGYTRAPDGAGALALSRGNAAVERRLAGWPIGVVGDHAYVAEAAGDELKIERVALTGEPEELARTDGVAKLGRFRGAVTGSGHVAFAERERVIVVAPDRTRRELALPGARVLAGNSRGSELAILSGSSLALVDAATGATRWTVPVGEAADAAAFVGGRLELVAEHRLVALDLATGAPTVIVADLYADARTVAFAPDGLAYVIDLHPSDIAPISLDRACEVFVARRGKPASAPEVKFDG
ncbi:MAG: hypothetical protein ACM31C_04115, partial [Acidobacteriota bacterium]